MAPLAPQPEKNGSGFEGETWKILEVRVVLTTRFTYIVSLYRKIMEDPADLPLPKSGTCVITAVLVCHSVFCRSSEFS